MPEPRPETPPMFPQSILSDGRAAARLSLLQSLLVDSDDSNENPPRVLLESLQSDPEMFSTLLSLLEVQNQNQLAMEEEERCDFDLCSSCAEKEEIENVCSRGHQLHPVQLVGNDIYHWICDVCDYQGKFYEDVVVWRCEEDKRYPRGAQSGENIELSKNKVSSSFQFIAVSIKTDQGSQSGDGDGGMSERAPATAEEDQQSSYLSLGARPKTGQDKK